MNFLIWDSGSPTPKPQTSELWVPEKESVFRVDTLNLLNRDTGSLWIPQECMLWRLARWCSRLRGEVQNFGYKVNHHCLGFGEEGGGHF